MADLEDGRLVALQRDMNLNWMTCFYSFVFLVGCGWGQFLLPLHLLCTYPFLELENTVGYEPKAKILIHKQGFIQTMYVPIICLFFGNLALFSRKSEKTAIRAHLRLASNPGRHGGRRDGQVHTVYACANCEYLSWLFVLPQKHE